MDRRNFIKSLGTLPVIYSLHGNTAWGATKNNNYQLKAQQTDWHLFSKDKAATKIWSFEDQSFGKPLYVEQHEAVTVDVSNRLEQSLGVHWHGIRLNNNMDGVPNLTQKPIPGEKGYFKYQFTSPDAGTFWYHTHSKSIEQMERGLLGPLIVKETSPYPVDNDVTFLIKDWKLNQDLQIKKDFDNTHEMLHDGRWGNVVTVNGKYFPSYSYRANSRLRFRFINGSNARIILLDLSVFDQAIIIAIDGHPIEKRKYKPMYLAPGMRMDVVVDLNASKRTYPIYEVASRKRIELMLVKTESKRVREKMLSTTPQSLPKNPLPNPLLSRAKVIDISLEGGAMSRRMMMGMMSGMFWTINGKAMHEDQNNKKPLLNLKKNGSYVFNIKNNTRFPHPMHIHGHTFKVFTNNPYWSDTALVFPDENMKIAFVADNPGLWMFHCHILGHLSSGMMGVIEVA